MPIPPGDAACALSVDVEDWFQVENLAGVVPRSSWDSRELRVEGSTRRVLELAAAAGARCTFFVLGWIAERCPGLVREIADAGHEVASHGYAHELVYSLSRADFRADVDRSKKLLEDLIGRRVRGYRAPSFSITDWAIPILQEVGFLYDSSCFPTVAHDRYGRLAGVDSSHGVVRLRPDFAEVCISSLPLGSLALPWGGGGYFRLLPYRVFRGGVRRILGSGRDYVFYVHPWEIDAGQPRLAGLSASHRFRHYVNLSRTGERLGALLRDFEWCSVEDLLARREAAPRSSGGG